MIDRLVGPQVKVERAKKHLIELESALQGFFRLNPYVVGTKRDPATRRLVYYLTRVTETPVEFSLITSEVLQHLRSSLDYLAYQLVLVGTGGPGPFSYVYFPIFDSFSEYESKKGRQIHGARPEAIAAIDALKPYKGGNDTLWRLHQLNRVDKHRLLVTVGSQFRSIDIGGHAV